MSTAISAIEMIFHGYRDKPSAELLDLYAALLMLPEDIRSEHASAIAVLRELLLERLDERFGS